MTETDNNAEGQKPKTSKLALTAFWLALVSVLAFFIFSFSVKPPPKSDYIRPAIGYIILLISFFTFCIGVPLAFILGIVSIIRIQISKGQLEGKRFGVAGTVISLLFASYFISSLSRIRSVSPLMMCGSNLSGLGKAMLIYANDNDGKYPTPDKWCDLLIEHGNVTERDFRCLGNKKARCSYAINPNCELNSPPDMVLLFETRGGWNQAGGSELLTLENHSGEGCVILFNDSRAEYIRPHKVSELKWEYKQKQ